MHVSYHSYFLLVLMPSVLSRQLRSMKRGDERTPMASITHTQLHTRTFSLDQIEQHRSKARHDS